MTEHVIPNMGPDEFAAHLRGLLNEAQYHDPQEAHTAAVQAMCELLEEMGYREGVRLYRQLVLLT